MEIFHKIKNNFKIEFLRDSMILLTFSISSRFLFGLPKRSHANRRSIPHL